MSEFNFVPGDTANPCEKYTQPKPYSVDLKNSSYPNNVANTQTEKTRGTGAATKGKSHARLKVGK